MNASRRIARHGFARISWRFSVLAVLALLLGSVAGQAQLAGKGGVNGTVTDSEGAAIPGAQVVATKIATGVSVTTTTTSAGDYNLPTLDPGEYTISVTATGFQKLTQEHVQVNALETATVSPKLTVGAATESVTVTSAPPQLETTNATLGATMEQEMYSELPIEMGAYGQPDQRRATDFAFLMPGVQGNNTNGNATTNTGVVNGSGPRGAVSGVYVDGVVFVRAGGNGDPRYVWTAISVDAVDQFQVQTNGYSAMYEGQGIQNYTVKQGGNKFHGAVYEFFRNTALDAWGFFPVQDPATKQLKKPVEHSNEFGINLSGAPVPFGTWRDKLFLFANYNGFRFVNEKPTAITFPTLAQQAGNFQGVITSSSGQVMNTGAELAQATGVGIYDPSTQASCTSHSTNGPCRYRYGYVYGGAAGAFGNPAIGPGGTAAVDVIPASQFSQVALNLQKLLPALNNQGLQNNYFSPNRTVLNNWSTTERIDYNISPSDVVTLVAAIGRQASGFPQGQTTAGRNVGPVPYNYGQAFTPKTAVGIAEETHTFSPHLVNQIKYGFARYNGPTFNSDFNPTYGAAGLGGITNLPVGQASNAMPIVAFSTSSINPPTQWAGATAGVTIAQNFTLVDNLQWQFGKHNLTLGGQIAWLEYLNQPATSGSTPLTLSPSQTQTAKINTSPAAGGGNTSAVSGTGLAYASFLVGQINSSSLTQYQVQEFASRFRAVSPFVQDNWKVTNRLTLDLGLRWDYFPPLREAHDYMSFFSPTATNPVTGSPGALIFAGHGANTCNCDTPLQTYWKNFGPRIGFAYQSDERTVWRGSFGVMFTHGGTVGGGNASSLGGANISQGFSSTVTTTSQSSLAPLFTGANTAYATVPAANGRNTAATYGTGNTTAAGFTGGPNSVAYLDPYLGSRAPEFINWSFGFQHQWTSNFTTTISYVGSQGHFLQADGSNARGYWADQLDPALLYLGDALQDTGAALQTDCATGKTKAGQSVTCPSNYTLFAAGQNLGTLLRPYPFQNVADYSANVANSSYHALQMVFQMRPWHGLSILSNYTWSHSIDDAGTFRSGYFIPATVSNNGQSWKADRIERSSSTINQPHHFVFTGTWKMPFGKDVANSQAWERAVLGGFTLSSIFQAYSGSPLAITGSACQTNPAQITCMPSYGGNFPSSANVMNGHWGKGVTYANTNISYINAAAFTYSANNTFGNLPRTAPYGLYGPGNYQWDLALVRTFPIWERVTLNFRAELYNITNHTQFQLANNATVVSSSSFGQVSAQANQPRQAQLSARLTW